MYMSVHVDLKLSNFPFLLPLLPGKQKLVLYVSESAEAVTFKRRKRDKRDSP